MVKTEEYYKNYWVGAKECREKRAYYERLYAHLLPKIRHNPSDRILDVAGGNGQFLKYLGVQDADVLDISPSGLEVAKQSGFNPILGDIQGRFPIPEDTYDTVFLFEVLEHLHSPLVTLSEIFHVLKEGGILYVGQPNMRADGVQHVRRYYPKELAADLKKSGFKIEWVDYVPAYTMRDSILSDIRKNSSWSRKVIQCVNLCLSFLPWKIRYRMAHFWPERFALLAVLKASKHRGA